MNLLIKIYLDDINPYDLSQLLDVLNKNIVQKASTKIYLMSNDLSFEFENYNFTYLNKISIPQMINYKLNELDWDIVLPIIRPCITTYGFDSKIKSTYSENFTDLDGCLWLNDGEQNDIIKYPVVGRNYYNRFGYLYNPAYNKKYFEEEFTDVLKLNKFYVVDKVLIKTLILKSDDDNIYELRKKFNFGLL